MMNGYNGPGASGIVRSSSPTPNGHELIILAKQKASLLWLLSKSFDNKIPEEFEDPYYKDHNGEDRLKPFLVQSLASAELYGMALANIYAYPSYNNMSHNGVLHVLARKGIYIQDPHDTLLTESVLIQTAPIKMSAHMVIIEAIMSLYIKEVLIPEKVAEVVHRFLPIDTETEELPEEAEDAAIFWINKSCQKFRQRIEFEIDLLTPTEEDDEDDYAVPEIAPVEYIWDLSDGVSLASLLAFYCPDELTWKEICYANPMTMTDSIYNLQLIQLFCQEKLPCDIFFLTIEDFFDCNKLFRINVLAFVADLLYHFEIRPVECVRLPTYHDIMSTEDELYVGFNNGTSSHSTLLRGARAISASSTTGHGFSAINQRTLNRSLASVTPVGHSAQVTPASQAASAAVAANSSSRFGRRRSSNTSNYGRVSLSGDGNYSNSGLGDITGPDAYGTPPTSANNSSSTLVRHSSSPVKGRRSSHDHSIRDGEGEEDLSRYFSILEVGGHETGRISPGTNNSPEQLHSSQSLHDVSISPRNSTTFNHSAVYQEVRSSTTVLTPNASATSSSFYSQQQQHQHPQQQQQQQQHHNQAQHQSRQLQQSSHLTQSPQLNNSPFVLQKSASSSRNHNSSTSQLDFSSEFKTMAPRNLNLSNSQLSSNHESSRNLSSHFNEHKASLSSLHRNSSSSGIVPHSTPIKEDYADVEAHSNCNATFNTSNNSTNATTASAGNNHHQSQSDKSSSPRPSTPGVGFFIATDGTVNTSTTELATTSTSELSMAKKKELIVQKSLKRKAEQEAKRLKMQEEAARKREEELRKNEESERKKEEERLRKQKILEEYRLKKQAEEEKKRGDTVDWVRSNGSASTLGYNGNHGPNNKHATVVLNRQRGARNAHHTSSEAVNASNTGTKTRPKSLHVSNALMEEFLSLDQRPSKTPAGTSTTTTSGLSSSPPTYNTPLSRNDSFNPLQSNTNLSSTGSSRPRSALSTSSKILSSTSTSHLSSIMPSMPPLYQRNRGPPSDGASDVGSNFSEYTGPRLYVKPSQKSNRGIILNAINVVLAGSVNAVQKQKVIEEINKSTAKHFLILFRGAGFQFRGIYTFCPDSEEAERLIGSGPKLVTNDKIEKFYKFNSGCKNFAIVHTKHLSITIDGFTILNHLWTANAARKVNQSNSNIHAAANAASAAD